MNMNDLTAGDLRMCASQISQVIVADHGGGWNRTVQYTVGGDLFEVIDHGKTVYAGSDAQKAVDAFHKAEKK